MNIVFISSTRYPDGGAPANRHMAYAKGLVKLGHNVKFILLSEQDNKSDVYTIDRIQFLNIFLSVTKKTPNNWLKKIILYKRIIRKAIEVVSDLHQDIEISAIILLDISSWLLNPFIKLARKNRIKVLHERTEYPFVVAGKRILDKINLRIYLTIILKKFNGIYVISNSLKKYFSLVVKNKVPITIINMIVDSDRFKNIEEYEENGIKYLAYCGDMSNSKDGVEILIKSFGGLVKSGKISDEIKLFLIGDCGDKSYRHQIENIIYELKCSSNIILIGRVDRTKIPKLLNNSKALVLARPKSKQAEGGFPTKLGEYLATGKPVIITDVGEVSNFLKDGINAFLAKPGDINSLSQKILEVLNDYPRALEVGNRGRILIDNEFNYCVQAKRLADFIVEI